MKEVIHNQNLNDTTPLRRYLRDGNSYIDLTGYTVTLTLTRKGVTKMSRTITVLDQLTDKGGVEWTPLLAEVNEEGIYRAIYTADNGVNAIQFPRGNKQRFYIWVK